MYAEAYSKETGQKNNHSFNLKLEKELANVTAIEKESYKALLTRRNENKGTTIVIDRSFANVMKLIEKDPYLKR